MIKQKLHQETARLLIRPYETSDYENWLTQYENRLPAQHKYDEGKLDMSTCTREWFEEMIHKQTQMALNDEAYVFGVFHKRNGTHIGVMDMSTLMRDDFQWARIGYTIHNQFWEQGYGKESLQGTLELAFQQLHFHRIEAHINLDNRASINLAKSAGMKFECIRKAFTCENNEWVDNFVYYIQQP
ncbi:GNAT family N-acetyltransferase [Priestia koreensis]|uniref:GNAT family acetyltransferase n=1 Tax=Priestia koreensis TaxID=284581 RepID=A0A0M0KXF0_9BACI|nr:GNAT family N-acetyltransferase [Priestia koreensis]KOO43484.1 GNAT family acetyltransferase [Priestia koreensis]